MKKYLIALFLLTFTSMSFSEDIELYISDTVKQAKKRPQVLIIFDNSGSMGTKERVKKPYNPNIDYKNENMWGGFLAELLDGVGGLLGGLLGGLFGNDTGLLDFIDREEKIYFSKGGDEIPSIFDENEKRKFPKDINSCKVAQDIIDEYGFYTGYVREYKFQGNSGRWTEFNQTNGSGFVVTDCEADVLNNNNHNEKYFNLNLGPLLTVKNDLPSGYPIDGEGSALSPEFYTNNVTDSNVEWSGSMVTLYSDNYLYWYHNDYIDTEERTRMEIAQESITNLINSSPNVDFGLEIFNYDFPNEYNRDGGRIVFGIKASTLTNRTALLDIINNKLDPETNTPLCESLYEASRYFGGKSVDFGDNDSNYGSYNANTPSRDTSIEADGKIYKSPFNSCSDKAYVILITDGEPTLDKAADNKIKALGNADNYPMSSYNGNYLAALAGWMNNNDVNKEVDGKQTVTTYTIGFSQGAEAAEPLLKKTAELGGGKYFPAQDTGSLTAALTNVLANLDPSNDSLTSASVAANNFDRTETLNSVYYAMFQPDRGPRWQGNLKKYKVENGKQVGKNGKSAINDNTGHFSTDVTSFWSTQKDGDNVAVGGVAEMLRNKANRVIYSDIGGATGSSLALYTMANLTASSNVFESKAGLATKLTVTENEVDKMIKWSQGIDVDDEDDDGSTSDRRSDVFGDPLHSKPLVVNYGNKIHLLIGTNSGALHMFIDSGDTVDETWAFMPKEFFPNIKTLRKNATSDDKVYGVDGKITSYVDDKDGDGIIEPGDKVWIFFGLRRGGSSYYALDISNPDSPSLMWQIKGGSNGFKELGQTWSTPKLVYSKLNLAGKVAKPSLIFGGGYDPSKDNNGVGAPDNIGRAIYMVDAETGSLLWSAAPENANTTFTAQDSVPSSIATLDSDGDGLVDRLYTGDTGGNLWRVDMPDNVKADFSVFKLASLGGNTNATDRRFFEEPAIVRTFITETLESQVIDAEGKSSKTIVHQEIPYDAVLIGSGDKSNPIGTDTDDIFFMLKDKNIATKTFSDVSKPAAITKADLFDITNNPIDNEDDNDELSKIKVALSAASGWFFDLEKSGEKSTANAVVINNTVFFTSYSPPSSSQSLVGCELPHGQGWLYAVDLAQGTKRFNWEAENANNREDRISFISEQFLGAPTLIVLPNNPDDPTAGSTGNLIVGRRIVPVGFNLQTMRTYLYVTEEQ